MRKNDDSSTHDGSFSEDWRIKLLGPYLQLNPKGSTPSSDVEEALTSLVPTEEALNRELYDYIALFIGADYCPHCKAFAPTVQASAAMLEEKRAKVVFVSNDRTEEAFQASCLKNAGLDVMPYDLDKTRAMRDLFGLTTIPALMILRNENFSEEIPKAIINARHALVADPKNFPWDPSKAEETGKEGQGAMSVMDRLIIRGKQGKWWELGHHSNPQKPDQMYMDEHAVRNRAGILNIITWIALINIFFWREPTFVKVLFPLVAIEFIVSANFGLVPAPIGTIATLMATVFHPKPFWKPAKPKRFAWYIGLSLATLCLLFFLLRGYLGSGYRPLIGLVVSTCNLATWLESSCGFCIGCFIYNTWLVPMMRWEECSECKL